MSLAELVLVGDHQAKAVIEAVCTRLPVVGTVGVDSPSAGRCFVDTERALESNPRPHSVCFLTPKHATFESLQRIVSAGVHVLCAGPLIATSEQLFQLDKLAAQQGVRIRLGGRERHAPALQRLMQLRVSDAFGEPVYARCVGGGGTTIPATWWSMCELLASASWLLQSQPERIFVGATRSGRARVHVTMTVAMQNRANAQLCVAPGECWNLPDTWLLGSGGTLLSRSEDGDILLAGSDNRTALGVDPQMLPEPQWIADFMAADGETGISTDVAAMETGHHLLKALRRALKEGRLQRCNSVL